MNILSINTILKQKLKVEYHICNLIFSFLGHEKKNHKLSLQVTMLITFEFCVSYSAALRLARSEAFFFISSY